MTSSAIPARLEFQCGHAALVSLPRIKGETSAQRTQRVTREKSAAQTRACDFCGPDVAIVVQASAPQVEAVSDAVLEATIEAVLEEILEAPVVEGHMDEEPVEVALETEELLAELEADVAPDEELLEEIEASAEREEPIVEILEVLDEAPVDEIVVAEPLVVEVDSIEPEVLETGVTEDVDAEVVAEAVAELVALAESEPEPAPARRRATRRPRRARATASAPVAVAAPAPVATPAPVARRTAAAPRATARRVTTPRRAAAPTLRQFTVAFRVERVISATDISDALRQVTQAGATTVLSISRE